MAFGVRVAICGVALAVGSACAARQPQSIAQRFVHRDDASSAAPITAAGSDRSTSPSSEQQEAFAAAMIRLRQAASAPPPARTTGAVTLESRDAELSRARALLAGHATAEHHRLVAESYARRHVLDAAFDHFSAALRLNSKDASSYDGRARIWRDWGFAGMGLSDAYHAIYLAPSSAAPQNTLGTLFLKIGLMDEARVAFERALKIDPHASYALENLCRIPAAADGGGRAADACAHGEP